VNFTGERVGLPVAAKMTADTDRILRLELQIVELTRDLEAECKLVKELREHINTTEKRINRAETFGRAVVWSTIAVGGFVTQFDWILEWLREK